MSETRLLRRTKIVCTVGPAVQSPERLQKLIENGMNVARLNFSHGDHKTHREMIRMIREASCAVGIPVALLADTKGPEIRTGELENDTPIELERDSRITLTTEQIPGTAKRLSISYQKLPKEVTTGTRLLIADGLIDLEVLDSTDTEIECLIHSNGTIGPKKNVNVVGVQTHLPAVSEKDLADLAFVMEENMDFVAASFVRKAMDVHEIHQVLESHRHKGQAIPSIIAKIEDEEGLSNIDDIIRVSSGIMVARGDLGVQLPPYEIPLVQKRIIKKCNQSGKVVIVATQMLDSMIRNPLPTRAEVADVANAILDGTDAIMLSGETAQGKYPVDAVAMMDRIALEIENCEYRFSNDTSDFGAGISVGVAKSAVITAKNIDAKAIVTPTYRGRTPRLLSRYRPQSPIVAITPFEGVQRRLLLRWGVYPLISPEVEETSIMLKQAVEMARQHGFLKPFDKFVIAAGTPIGSPIMLNTVQTDILAEVVAHGQRGFGQTAGGTVVKATNIFEAENKLEGDGSEILIIRYLDFSYLPLMRKIAGYAVEHFSATPFETLSEYNPSLVGIAGAAGVFDSLEDGDTVVLNGSEKLVLKSDG